MIDHSAISQGDALRAEIAAKTAAYEAAFGPVETLPILNHDKRVPFRLACPEKKQALSENQAKTRSRSRNNTRNAQIRANNRERVLALAKCTMGAKAIAERTGISVTTVRSILKEAASQ